MAFFVPVAAAAWQAENGAMAANDHLYLWLALGTGVIGLVAALLFARAVLSSDAGTPEMQRISNAIREGAEAFMKRQYSTIAMIAIALAIFSSLDTAFRPLPLPTQTRSSSAS